MMDKPVKPQSQDLASELDEHEGCRLLVIDRDRSEELARALDSRGVAYRRLPDTADFALLAQMSSDCPWKK